jgi:SAM-dependent methyltransferase
VNPHHDGPLGAPSDWLVRWAHLIAPQGRVLDVACGAGRHLACMAERGHPTTGVDIDVQAARGQVPQAQLLQADLEGAPWPAAHLGAPFDAVLVFNYLWRPLWPQLLASLAPGGVLLYETFGAGQEQLGRPRRAEFLLQAGELLQVCQGLHIVAYECGLASDPDRVVQRIAAVRPVAGAALPPPLSLK